VAIPRSSRVLIALLALSAGCRISSRDAGRRHASVPDSLTAHGAAPGTISARSILVTAHDYSFTGVPSRIRAGWLTLRLANAGTEVHMLGIGRVPYGHPARAVLDAIVNNHSVPPTSDWGGPNAVSPGDTSAATLFFPPGEYAISCAVEGPDGKIHAQHGMIAVMTVTGTPDTTDAPASEDASVTLTDYHVAVRGSLVSGERTLRVKNNASQGHDLEILEILPGHSEADAMRWFAHPTREAPTARAVGGVVEIHPGQQAVVSASFHSGKYLFLCWVPDDAGQPHFLRGMHQLITVRAARRS
jgi:uncharacterized cupredoxin-like copper-binding protein